MPNHKDLTGANLHEPKGAATAVSGAVYVANGSGSGAWTVLDIPEGTFTVQTALFTSSGTWTKPADTFLVRVFAQGGGEGSGAAGAGTNGSSTSFGAHLTATGGGAATGSSGDIHLETGTPSFFVAAPFAKANGGVDVSSYADFVNQGRNGNWTVETYAAASLASTVAVTIGGGGAGSGGTLPTAGTAGILVAESYILI